MDDMLIEPRAATAWFCKWQVGVNDLTDHIQTESVSEENTTLLSKDFGEKIGQFARTYRRDLFRHLDVGVRYIMKKSSGKKTFLK